MQLRSGEDLVPSDKLFVRFCELRDARPLEPLTTVLTRLSNEFGLDLELLQQTADAQLWENQYRELLLLNTANLVAWARASAPSRHLKVIMEMQRLALQKFETMGGRDVRTAEEARRLAHTSIELERLLLGQATNITQVADGDLDQRIQWLQKKLAEYEGTIVDVPVLDKST